MKRKFGEKTSFLVYFLSYLFIVSECTLFEQPRSFFCKKCWFTEVEIQFSFLLQWTRASATSSAKTHRKEYLNHVIADVDMAKSGNIRGWKCTIEGFILAYLKIVDMNWRTSVAEGQLDKKIQTIFLLLANVYQTASLSVWNGAAYIYQREDGHLKNHLGAIDLVCTQHRGEGGLPKCVHST